MTAQITESDLFAIGMESPTAWQLMPQLCAALGIEYPPSITHEANDKREQMADPLHIFNITNTEHTNEHRNHGPRQLGFRQVNQLAQSRP